MVNVGRGTVVDEDALLPALRDDRISFAALDVFATEPLPAESPLWDEPNVLVSPHTAALNAAEDRLIAELFAANATRLLDGGELQNRVDTVDFYSIRRLRTHPAPAVSRALRILTLLERWPTQPMPLGDIARGIGAAKSSTSNLCQALEEGSMILRTPSGYLLGRRTVELGGAYIAQFNQMREFYVLPRHAEC